MAQQLKEITAEAAKQLRASGFGYLIKTKKEVRYYVKPANGKAVSPQKGLGSLRPKAKFQRLTLTKATAYTGQSEMESLVYIAIKEILAAQPKKTNESKRSMNKAKLRDAVAKNTGYSVQQVRCVLYQLTTKGYITSYAEPAK